MSVLENFKNIPRSPYEGATRLKCIFFLQICNKIPGEKKEGGLSPTPGATGPCVLAWPTKPIEFYSSSVRRFIVIYLQKDLEIEFELS